MRYSKDYYTILGIPPTASDGEIKKAYRQMCKKFHPDLNPDEDTKEKMQEINEAGEILLNKSKRRAYDEYRRNDEQEKKRRYTETEPPPPQWYSYDYTPPKAKRGKERVVGIFGALAGVVIVFSAMAILHVFGVSSMHLLYTISVFALPAVGGVIGFFAISRELTVKKSVLVFVRVFGFCFGILAVVAMVFYEPME